MRANSSTFGHWASTVRVRGSMKLDTFQGTIAMTASLTDKSRLVVPVNTILDLLQEAKLIQIDGEVEKLWSLRCPWSAACPRIWPGSYSSPRFFPLT